MPMPDGRIGHAELGYRDDVDAHHARAKEAGAVVTTPEDQPYGDRSYRAVDPEGHRWIFSTHLRDVAPDEIVAAE